MTLLKVVSGDDRGHWQDLKLTIGSDMTFNDLWSARDSAARGETYSE